MIDKPLSDHARIADELIVTLTLEHDVDLSPAACDAIHAALTALREEREQLMKENETLLARRASEGDSPRQPAAPTDKGCINCGETNDGGYMSGLEGSENEGNVGPFCATCFGFLEETFVQPPSADARLTDSEVGKASGSATDRDLRTEIAHLTEEREGLRTENQKLLRIINRVLDNFIYQPQSRLYSVTEVAWMNQPYMFKTPGEWLKAELDALLSPREGTPTTEGTE